MAGDDRRARAGPQVTVDVVAVRGVDAFTGGWARRGGDRSPSPALNVRAFGVGHVGRRGALRLSRM
ncbi:hypothetical protein [Actinomadura atramentaria]|uniref:hypothetical protein n=1 Tax=Actinomadura atramentaria TaxID=1990 RepID=UPI00039C3AB5|nr:hypothetical protein [Actinomadura atramentaria]